jgi:hypothetical protein
MKVRMPRYGPPCSPIDSPTKNDRNRTAAAVVIAVPRRLIPLLVIACTKARTGLLLSVMSASSPHTG